MPNFSQAVETSFIALSIGAIFVFVGIAILLVKKFK
jgi:flagellar biogenesis protein FliO